MPRQNRVDPFGDLIVTEARGTLMGNRGILHDDDGRLLSRRWTHQNWVACILETKGPKREVMKPGNYTELFFLDEATALAAGHRPCCECRRDEYQRFREAWLRGNPELGFTASTPVSDIDRVMHRERVTRFRQKVTYQSQITDLPSGACVSLPQREGEAFLVWQGYLHKWQPNGYGEPVRMDVEVMVTVLTPQSIVKAIRAGYTPSVTCAA